MRTLPALAAGLCLLLAPAGPMASPAASVLEPGPLRGITLGLFHPQDRERYRESLREIRELHATHVAILVPLEQHDIHSDSVFTSELHCPPDSLILLVCAAAARESLGVVLFPVLNLEETEIGKWRGTLEPRSWDRWFRSYGDQMEHLAGLAQEGGVSWLCAGAELLSSEHRAGPWNRLLARLRQRFTGRLFYSQNWDRPGKLPFERGLDAVAVNAYFELSPSRSPGARVLKRAWQAHRRVLNPRMRGRSVPWFFSEVGYPSMTGGAGKPWDYLAEGAADPQLQARCFRAFFESWSGDAGCSGSFVYLWSMAESGPGDRGYSLRGKPAAEIVRSWYLHGFPRGAP